MSGGEKKEEGERERREGGREGRRRKREREWKRKRNIDNKRSVHGLITGLKSTLVMYSASTLVMVRSVM